MKLKTLKRRMHDIIKGIADDYRVFAPGEIATVHELIESDFDQVGEAKELEKLDALLAQERKLTAKLDDDIETLEDANGVLTEACLTWVDTFDQHRDEVAGLEIQLHEQNVDVKNLQEKNDNQFKIINGLQDTSTRVTARLDDSLKDWVIMRDLRDAWHKKCEGLKVKLHAANGQLGDLRSDMGQMVHDRDDTDAAYAKLIALNCELEGQLDTTVSNLGNVNLEAKVTEEMVAKIVDAMQGAGYEISGWGNDADLEELERRAETLHDAAETLRGVTNTVEETSVDLDVKLDNIRTER